MKLALSNFAWDFPELENISKVLNETGIEYVEVVFSKYCDWNDITTEKVTELKELLDKYNLKAISSQSLFYNVDCKSIVTESEKFINHVQKLIEYSKILGIKVLVFGSPALRKVGGYTFSNLHETFNKIDALLDGTDIVFCIEPNSKIYGGEFFYTIKEIVSFLTTFKYKNIVTMCDTHNSWLEGQDPNDELTKYKDYIKHIHISEVNLDIITDSKKHDEIKQTLMEINFDGLLTYEVKPNENLNQSIKLFSEIYK